jgi:hypothetical protein
VQDGVSAPEGFATGCRHTPGWYVRRLSARLAEAGADPSSTLGDVLAAAVTVVRSDHGGDCDLDNPASPAATVCLARATVPGRHRDHNADAGHAYRADDGTVTAAVIDSTCSTRRRSRRSACRSRTA